MVVRGHSLGVRVENAEKVRNQPGDIETLWGQDAGREIGGHLAEGLVAFLERVEGGDLMHQRDPMNGGYGDQLLVLTCNTQARAHTVTSSCAPQTSFLMPGDNHSSVLLH